MKMSNQTFTAKLRDHLAEKGPCPQTGGHPLRCTKVGFDRGCRYYRQKADHKSALSYQSFDRCRSCSNYPAEVEFFKIDELTKERTMATAKTENGTCELCGQKRKGLKHHLDHHVCTSCAHILTAAKNRPETLRRALEELAGIHGLPFELSEEAKRTAVDNGGKNISPEILKRLENLERLGVKIQKMEDLHQKFFEFCNQALTGGFKSRNEVVSENCQ